MNKLDLINSISKKTDLESDVVEKIINALKDEIISKLKNKEEVMITGLGAFSSKFRAARMGVNPRNPSEKISMPAITVPKFKAGKTLKDALKNINSEPQENKTEE